MQRFVNKLLLTALLILCAPLGFHRTQGGRNGRPNVMAESAGASDGRARGVPVRMNRDLFVLKDFSLTTTTASTILKGEVVNAASGRLGRATFAVRAYNSEGELLHGFEEVNIFTAPELEPGAGASINSGYGVWLQGIPLSAISRIEIDETGESTLEPLKIPGGELDAREDYGD